MPEDPTQHDPQPRSRRPTIIAAGLLLAALALVVLYTGRGAFLSPVALVVIAAIGALFADVLHLSAAVMLIAALVAVVSFAVSGIIAISALRKPPA